MPTASPPRTPARRRPDRWSRENARVSLVRPIAPPRPLGFAARPDALVIDLARTALIVIDMQNEFLDPAGWFASVRGADVSPLASVVAPINRLSAACRRARVPIIHLNWGVRRDLANLPPNVLDKGSDCGAVPGYGDRIDAGEVLVEGSWGASGVSAVEREASDLHVSKHRLSGFHDNELDQILRRLRVDTLLYSGVNLDRCVFATLMDGCFRGYDAVLVEDATTTVSSAEVSDAITFLVRELYGFTTTSAELLDALRTTTTDTGEEACR